MHSRADAACPRYTHVPEIHRHRYRHRPDRHRPDRYRPERHRFDRHRPERRDLRCIDLRPETEVESR